MSGHQRTYPATTTVSKRKAFTCSTDLEEDWTKISDVAERRRIQNRIAQRNYRKKLKRRLEDLQRRVGQEDSTATARKQIPPEIVECQSQSLVRTEIMPASTETLNRDQSIFTVDEELHFAHTCNDVYGRSNATSQLACLTFVLPGEMEIYPTHLAAAAPMTLLPVNHSNDSTNLIKLHSSRDDCCAYINGYVSGVDMNTPGSCAPRSCNLSPSHSLSHLTGDYNAGCECSTTPLFVPGSPNKILEYNAV